MSSFVFLYLALAVVVSSQPAPVDPNRCLASSRATSLSEARSTVATAVTQAVAECTSCPCDSIAQSKATVISEAAAIAIANVELEIRGGEGCEGFASGSANAQSEATGIAESFSSSLAQSCGAEAQSTSQTISETFLSAAATAEATISSSGGDASATATSISENIQPIVATSLSEALASCKCGSNGEAGGGGSASAAAQTPEQEATQEFQAACECVCDCRRDNPGRGGGREFAPGQNKGETCRSDLEKSQRLESSEKCTPNDTACFEKKAQEYLVRCECETRCPMIVPSASRGKAGGKRRS